MADRFSIDKKYATDLAKGDIKKYDVLHLNSERNQQTLLFIIAMALGVREGIRTPSTVKEALVLEQPFKNTESAMSYVYSVALQELRREGRENEINDTNIVYSIAEEYANTGFKKIKELVPDFKKFDEEGFELELIDMMDTIYDEIAEQLDNQV